MPVPNDIIQQIKSNRTIVDYTPPEGRTKFPTEQEIKNVSAMVEEVRNSMVSMKEKMQGDERNKNDYSHFNKLPEEAKKEMKSKLRNMSKH